MASLVLIMWRLTSHRPVTPLHSSWQETVDSLYPYHLLPRDEDSLARLLGAEDMEEVVKERDLNIQEVLRLEPQARRRRCLQ